MQELNLTDEQSSKIETVHLGLMKSVLPLENQLRVNRAEIKKLTTTDNPDMKAINKLIDESSQLEASMRKTRAAAHQEVRSILTDEQRIKFDSSPQRMQLHQRKMDHRQGQGRPSQNRPNQR